MMSGGMAPRRKETMFHLEITYKEGIAEWVDDLATLAEAIERTEASLDEDWSDGIKEIVIYEDHTDGVLYSVYSVEKYHAS